MVDAESVVALMVDAETEFAPTDPVIIRFAFIVVSPDVVSELNEGEATSEIIGLMDVPPVNKLPFAPTLETPTPFPCKNI